MKLKKIPETAYKDKNDEPQSPVNIQTSRASPGRSNRANESPQLSPGKARKYSKKKVGDINKELSK